MARFYGEVGYGETKEVPPGSGVWVDEITEQTYIGDVIRSVKRDEYGENLNPDLKVNNSISIMADEYAIKHFFKIRYVRWEGVPWTISAIEVKAPRLVLSLGSVYNGPTS